MSYCPEYKEKVKQAVCKLLDLTYQGKFHVLTLDTDEDTPFVDAWIRGKSYRFGYHRDGTFDKDDDGPFSFLDCCEKALAAIELASAPMSEPNEDKTDGV